MAAALKQTARLALRSLLSISLIRTCLRAFSSRGFLPRAIWQRLPVTTVFQVIISDSESFRYSGFANDVIGRSLYWRGLASWEPETISRFLKLARTARIFVDVGANTGIYTLLALAVNPSIQVVSFEPVPRIRQKLEESLRLNGWGARCDLRAEAVSNEPGTARFHVPHGDCPTSASLNEKGFRGFDGELISVPVTTLDAVCESFATVDLVKVDVEGFEDKALEGMRSVLDRCAPDLLLECNPDGPTKRVEALLHEFSYRFFHLTGDGPRPRAAMLPDPTERFRNYLCSTRPNLEHKGLAQG